MLPPNYGCTSVYVNLNIVGLSKLDLYCLNMIYKHFIFIKRKIHRPVWFYQKKRKQILFDTRKITIL